MRKVIFAVALTGLLIGAFFLVSTGAWTQVQETFNAYINSLPVATSINPTDQFYVRQNGVSKQAPASIVGSGGGGGGISAAGTVAGNDCVKWVNSAIVSDAGAPCGTVSSVGVAAPSGLAVTGSPVTNSGTIGLNWSGTIPNAQIPLPTVSALGGVQSATGTAGQFMTGINTSGVPQFGTPSGAGTVTSVGVTAPTGLSVTGSPITSSGTIGLNWSGTIPNAQMPNPTVSAKGGVESATAGTGQFMTGINTLGVPQFGTPSGTVSSVGATVPTGLSVSGSPVTTSGTLAFNWSGTIPNAQIPTPGASVLGGVESVTCGGGQFLNGINTSGVPGCSTPAGGGNVSTSGTITSGNCAQWNSTTTLISASGPCGSGGSGTNLGYINITIYGADNGDNGVCTQLSSIYGSLAAAQAVYPFVSDLTQCVDWAATQQAINVAYSVPAVASGVSQAVYCPAVTAGTRRTLSNPLFVDQPNNTAGTNPAWAAGTTYGNGATVTYNGIPWQSQGSGNVGNPPTSVDGFPAQLHILNVGSFPFESIGISNGSPAVFSIAPGFLGVTANQPLIFTPQAWPDPATGATPALPAGVNANQVYYVVGSSINVAAGTFNVSTTPGGAAINTTSAGVGNFFAQAQVWMVAPNTSAPNFGNRYAFIGSDGMTGGNSGCIYGYGGWQSGAFYLGPQTGNLIKSVQLYGPGGAAVYRCNLPNSSFGFVQMDTNGGSHATVFDKTDASGFNINYVIGVGNGNLGDSNTFFGASARGGCIGVSFNEDQAFVNEMYSTVVFENATAVDAGLVDGVKIIGGNHSSDAIANAFTISGLTGNFVGGVEVYTATISNPDQYLQSPMCAYNAGYYFANLRGSTFQALASPRMGNCVYTVFTVVTPHWGVVPFYIGNFNPTTNKISLITPASWLEGYSSCCGSTLNSDLAAATTLYAAEMLKTWDGNVQVDSVHMESAGFATQLLCNCLEFGGSRAAELRHVKFNAAQSLGDGWCCNTGVPDTRFYPHYLAQQVTPFITSLQGDVIVDALAGGQNFNQNDYDRLLLAIEQTSHFENRHTNVATPRFQFLNNSIVSYDLLSLAAGTGYQLSNAHFWSGSPAFGSGLFDSPAWFLPFSNQSTDINNTQQFTDQASLWRSQGYGIHRNWGLAPARDSSACIAPSQVTALGSLPTITHVSQLQNNVRIASGGTSYTAGDVLTVSGGTSTQTAQITVDAVSSGVITAVHVSRAGNYTVEPPATMSVTGGSGSGATFSNGNWFVNYSIPYPMLWGGAIYHVCDYVGTTQTKYALQSNNLGYSYFQNLTTTNTPNLKWSMDGSAPFVYMNHEALELMFPGLEITLTPDGTGGCAASAETFIVTEVHGGLGFGYVKVIRADSDGAPQLPGWGAGNTCTNTTIGQQTTNLVNPY